MSGHATIVIADDGLVGACLANLLVRRKAAAAEEIVLVESRLPARLKAGVDIDLRVSAISRASEHILTACGVWDRLDRAYVAPYERMCVWDETGSPDGLGGIRFDCADIGEPNLGYIVENRQLQWHLLETARASGVRIENAAVSGVEKPEDATESAIRVDLSNGATWHTRLLVAADGADSPTRTALGETLNDSALGHAVVAHVSTELGHQRTAWQRFLPTGPVAFLPLPDGRSSIVWSTTPGEAAELLALEDAPFCERLEQATASVLGRIEACGTRVGFPLRSGQARRYAGPNWVLAGDAAHSVHPLAGQGVNLGFLDCASLAEVLAQARARGEAIGDLRVLRRYERGRKGENLAMLAALEGLNGLFSNRSTLLGIARRLGLSAVDRTPPLKQFFMRRALGLRGDTPRWVRGEDQAPLHGGQ